MKIAPLLREEIGFETLVVQVQAGQFQGSFKIDGIETIAITDATTAEEAHIQTLPAVQKSFRNRIR